MPNAELFQSVVQFAGQAREFFDAGVRTNLLQNLAEMGHPYGLLLFSNSANGSGGILQESARFKAQGNNSLIVTFSSLLPFSSSESSCPTKNPFDGDNSSILSYVGGLFSWSGSISSTKLKMPDVARNGFLFAQQVFLAPFFLKAFAGEISPERSRELHVGKNSVSLGITAIKLAIYQGKEPFMVRTLQGEPIAQINPGDQLGHLHVSHQAALMRGLSPLQKAEQITSDFIELFRAVNDGGANLDTKQQEVLAKAQNATLIGISHLVRLFRRRTGLPTWKLDVLPELVQKFHQHDSQAVSQAFGGTRKVKPNDVEMMIITPQMRQQLAVVYA